MSEAHQRGIDIVMDLVANHCSSEHPWFKKACADPTCEEAGYFYFVKAKQRNNLRSYFGGSVWSLVPGQTDLYYSHYFAKEQPDLNWHNPKLRERIYQIVNFWIDRGVKGFRIDAILSIIKYLSFPNLPPDSAGDGLSHAANMNAKLLDKIGPYLIELKERTFERADCFTVGEVLTVTPESVKVFAGKQGYFSTLFDLSCREKIETFPHYIDFPTLLPDDFAACVFATQELYQRNNALVAPIIENHDEPRGVSYFLPDYLQNATGAKCLATILMMLRGIPFIYQGQEIGMTNTKFNSPEEFDDLYAKEELRYCQQMGMSEEEALECVSRHSRDNARTVFLWDDSEYAGFSTVKPWMKVHQDYKTLNVAAQESDPNSTLNYYRNLVALRKSNEALSFGSFERWDLISGVLAYYRTTKSERILVIANTNKNAYHLELADTTNAKLLLSANAATLQKLKLTLGCGGAAIIKLSSCTY